MLQNSIYKKFAPDIKVELDGTQPGDILFLDANEAIARLPKGPVGTVLKVNDSGSLEYAPLDLVSVTVVADEAARLASGATLNSVFRQVDNGVSYILAAVPATNAANWEAIGDTVITSGDIIGLINPNKLSNDTPAAFVYLNGAQEFYRLQQLHLSEEADSPTAIAIQPQTSYRAIRTAGAQEFSTPVAPVVGDVFEVIGRNVDGWRVNQSAGTITRFGDVDTITPGSGYVESTSGYDSATFRCVESDGTNFVWQVTNAVSAGLSLVSV